MTKLQLYILLHYSLYNVDLDRGFLLPMVGSEPINELVRLGYLRPSDHADLLNICVDHPKFGITREGLDYIEDSVPHTDR